VDAPSGMHVSNATALVRLIESVCTYKIKGNIFQTTTSSVLVAAAYMEWSLLSHIYAVWLTVMLIWSGVSYHA